MSFQSDCENGSLLKMEYFIAVRGLALEMCFMHECTMLLSISLKA